MKTSINIIVSQIIELALNINSNDQVRDIYSILLDVNLSVGEIMCKTLEQGRPNELNEKVLPNRT